MSELSKKTFYSAKKLSTSRRTMYRWAKNNLDPKEIVDELGSQKLLKVKTVAEMLNVNRSTIYRWVDLGLLKAIRFVNSIRIVEKSVYDLMEEMP